MAIKATATVTLTRVDDGVNGKGIQMITNYYLAYTTSTGVTTSTLGWSTVIPTMNTTNRYLWNYEEISYTDGSSSTTTPVIIGVHGATGAAGKGISSIVEYYLVSSAATGVTTGTSGWVTSIPTMTVTNRYLWNYEVINYTSGSATTTTPKVIGVYGDTGQGVESITPEYYLSTSKVTPTGGSWVTSPPTWTSGKYMWTRSKIVYNNPTSTVYTTPICDTSWEVAGEVDKKVETTINRVSSIESNLDSITSRVEKTETSVTTIDDKVSNVETRMSSAEQKITSEAILSSVNKQIGAGGAITTTSTILDSTGFTVKNGSLTVQNNAGEPVLTSDILGNLKIIGDITAGGSVGNSTIKVVDSLGKVVFGANYEGAKAKSFEVADIDGTTIPGKDGEDIWVVTTSYRNRMTSSASVVEYDKFITHGLKDSVITNPTGMTLEKYQGFELVGKTTISTSEINVFNQELKGGSSNTSSISPTLVSSGGSVEAKSGNIAVTNVNATGTDVSYLKMIRGNGVLGGQFTSSADGLGVRLHMYNDTGVWASYFRFENTGKFISPSVEINGTEGLYVNYYLSAQNVRASGATRVTNLNARLVSGWYSFAGASNAPCTYGILYTAQWNADGDFSQLVIGSNNALYTRYYINGGYTAWSTK